MPRQLHTTPMGSLRAYRQALKIPQYAAFARRTLSSQAPSPAKPTNPHRQFYKQYTAPWTKVFLGAFFTYQALYWAWLKLEALELKHEKDAEIKGLEDKIRELAGPGSQQS